MRKQDNIRQQGKALRVVGWFFTVIIIPILILSFIVAGDEALGPEIFMFTSWLLIGLFPLWSGRRLIRKAEQEENNEINPNPRVKTGSNTSASVVEPNYELKIIKLAKEKDGLISRVDVVLALNISSKKAQLIIDELYAEGLFDIQLTEKGSTLYKLRNYFSSEERQTASSV